MESSISSRSGASRHRVILSAITVLVLIFAIIPVWSAQTVPSIKMKVTLYDYRGDGSNPEFEPHSGLTVKTALLSTGLVRDSLDADRKPVRNAAMDTADPRLYRLLNLYKWFRPWQKNDPVPTYTYNDTVIDYWYDSSSNVFFDTTIITAGTVTGDTMFRNIVIDDSLLLVRIPDTTIARTYLNGTMTAETTIIAQSYKTLGRYYFPLDGRGFNDTTPNNDFTMEMHNSFTYRGGEVLKVASDDDCWAFINGRLVVDLGNFHGTEDTIIRLDSLKLTRGSVYPFDLFFADRARSDAVLNIATTMDFLDKTSGTAVVGDNGMTVKRRGGSAPAGSLVRVFGGNKMHIPSVNGAVRWTMLVTDFKGKVVARKTSGTAEGLWGGVTVGRMGSGSYVVGISCRDEGGRVLWEGARVGMVWRREW